VARETALLVEMLDGAFGGRAWHGTTLTGALRGVTPKQALWRPARHRHCVWDLVLHTAYWKYAVRCRITGVRPEGGFPRSPSNWPAVPTRPDAVQWRRDLQLLKQTHAELRASVKGLSPRSLDKRLQGGKWRCAQLIHGAASHDLYHTGQIQLLKRLMKR
jgi:hypothetical protein